MRTCLSSLFSSETTPKLIIILLSNHTNIFLLLSYVNKASSSSIIFQLSAQDKLCLAVVTLDFNVAVNRPHEQNGGANGPNGRSCQDRRMGRSPWIPCTCPRRRGLLQHHQDMCHLHQAGHSTGRHQQRHHGNIKPPQNPHLPRRNEETSKGLPASYCPGSCHSRRIRWNNTKHNKSQLLSSNYGTFWSLVVYEKVHTLKWTLYSAHQCDVLRLNVKCHNWSWRARRHF